jgi:hypothetical protein
MQIFVIGIFFFFGLFFYRFFTFCFSLVYAIGGLLSPFIGAMIDRIGYNIYWLFIGVVATIGTHCLIAFTYSNPFLNMVILCFYGKNNYLLFIFNFIVKFRHS